MTEIPEVRRWADIMDSHRSDGTIGRDNVPPTHKIADDAIKALEATLAERDRRWEWLRAEMERTSKHGIDIYVRRNANDFLTMMARAEHGGDHDCIPPARGEHE